MATNQTHKSGGLTLIELLVYIGLLTFLTVIIMDTLVSVSRLNARQSAAQSLTRSALISLNRLDTEIRMANDASAAGDTLILTGVDSAENPRTVEFFSSGSTLAWRVNGEEMGSLTETGVEMSALVFSIETASTTKAVHASFELGGTPYELTAVIRRVQ